jgi:hypothetical protein
MRDVVAAEKRVQDVSEALFAGYDLPGLFSSEWKAFVAAAHQYGVAHHGSTFPDDTDDCPYCRRGLDEDSRELIQKYKTYLVDDSQQVLRTSRQSLETLVSGVVDLTISAEPAANGNGDSDAGPVTDSVNRIRALALRQKQRLSEQRPWDIDAEVGQLRDDRLVLDEQREAASRSVRSICLPCRAVTLGWSWSS